MESKGNRRAEGSSHEPGREAHVPASERSDRAWNRVLRFGLVAAILIHVAVLLTTRSVRTPTPPFGAAGPQAYDALAAAGGGGGMEVVRVRMEEQRVPTEDPVPVVVPVPELPEVEVDVPVPQETELPEPMPEASLSLPGRGDTGSGPESGDLDGPGLTAGSGLGGGGADAEGSSGMLAPVPRGMILPPADRPRSVRGKEVTVWVFVNESGRVLSDSTRLEPPTPDAGYNRRLRQSAAEWSFEPARRTGSPVAAWYPYEIEL